MNSGKLYLIGQRTRNKEKIVGPRVRELQRIQWEHTHDYMPNDSILYSADSCLSLIRTFFFVADPIQLQFSVILMDVSDLV